MVQVVDVSALLKQWKVRLKDHEDYSSDYLDALSDCIYELSNIVYEDSQDFPEDTEPNYLQFLFH